MGGGGGGVEAKSYTHGKCRKNARPLQKVYKRIKNYLEGYTQMREMQMQAVTAKTKGNNTLRVSNIRSSRAFTNTENSPGVRG